MDAVRDAVEVGGRSVWELDPAHSLVEFSARHMMITTVRGRFGGVTGRILLDAESPEASEVDVTIDPATLDTGVEQRDAHLRSGDFLDVEAYPGLVFRSRSVEGARGEPGERFRVVGDLTIRDVTREVVLEVRYEGRGTDPWGGERVSYSAETRIDRRDFGLTWNQALETGGVLVGNEIRIQVQAQAVRQND